MPRINISITKRKLPNIEHNHGQVYVVENKHGTLGFLFAKDSNFIVVQEGYHKTNPCMYAFQKEEDVLKQFSPLYEVTTTFEIKANIDENVKGD